MNVLVRSVASLRTTVAGLVALAAVAVALRFGSAVPPAAMAVPAAVLTCNLVAALLTHRRLRSEPALALFHWALAGVAVLIGVSALARFEGRAEITEGVAFDPEQVEVSVASPFAVGRVTGVHFVQESLEVEYLPGLSRQALTSTVSVGGERREVSEHAPLELGGYRFSPTANKGFALVLAFRGDSGSVVRGVVHLPSYPVYEWRQEAVWTTPRGERLVIAFRPNKPVPMDVPWTLSRAMAEGAVTVRRADGATGRDAGVRLDPGAALAVAGGDLVLEDVRLWLGYRIEHDPAQPALFVVAGLALAALSWQVLGGVSRWPRRAQRRVSGGDAHVVDAR